MRPETRYALSEDVHLAYQVIGEGPIDIVFAPGFIMHIEWAWEEPHLARFLARLASFSRVIFFDKRGTGLSDPVSALPTMDQRMDDIRAVMDAAGSERAVIFGNSEGGPMAVLFAATYPHRTSALITFATVVKVLRSPDFEIGIESSYVEWLIEGIERFWGTGVGHELVNPSTAGDDDHRQWFGKLQRLGGSPAMAVALLQMNTEIDIRGILQTVSVPTLIIHRRGDAWVPPDQSRYMAEKIPMAKYVELDGDDHFPWFGDSDAVLAEVEEFVTGTRTPPEPDRLLATVLFTDIVGSTERAAQVGDLKWKESLNKHDSIVQREVEGSRGRLIRSTGDGVLATFDGPTRAIKCACSIREAIKGLGMEVRAGLHTGEIELRGGGVDGIAVHIAQRVLSQADSGEILVSRTVVDLVGGSGIVFGSRGAHVLKGVPGDWQIFSVDFAPEGVRLL